MYIPKHFNVSDEKSIRDFIEENSFGQLISTHEGSVVSTHMPFLYDAQNRKLLGHLAKANPQWQQIEKQNILVTLQGDHAYGGQAGMSMPASQLGTIRRYIWKASLRTSMTPRGSNL